MMMGDVRQPSMEMKEKDGEDEMVGNACNGMNLERHPR